MNPTRASENQALRTELARLLRRLRAIRREASSHDEQASRTQRELVKAGRVSSFIFFQRRNAAAVPVPAVDHEKLREWREAAAERREATAEPPTHVA